MRPAAAANGDTCAAIGRAAGPRRVLSGSAEQRSGLHFGHHRCHRWVCPASSGGVITRYGSGLSSPKMTSVASTTNSPGLSIPIPARGPARRLRRQYPRDRAAACVIQRLGADERGPRRVSVGGGHDHAHPGCDGDRPLPGRSVPRRVCPSVVADPATVRAPEPVG